MTTKNVFRLIVLLFAAWSARTVSAQINTQTTEQKARDLRYEKDAAQPDLQAAKAVTIPRSYALVIGIAKYKNLGGKDQLQFSERDAAAIYAALISPEGGSFRAENVHQLVGPKATLEAIRTELEEWLPTVAQPEDRVLIYFAGHGFVSDGKPYLAPYDVDPKRISQTAYPMQALGSVFGGKIKAKWKVLLTDACHSGAIQPEADTQRINQSLMDLSQSVFSLTASRDREASLESLKWGGGHGVFTYYVVKALEGAADENRDGIVNADEIAEYVRRNVRDETGGRQNPTSERASFDPKMLLAFVPSNVAPDAPPAPKFGAFVFEADVDDVEVFVDDKSVGVLKKGQPLRVPGLLPGSHIIKGVKLGYEPHGPREEVIYPGQESTVSIRNLIARRRPPRAEGAFNKGVELYRDKGNSENYKKAIVSFKEALDLDPKYSDALLFLARTYHILFDYQNAKKYFRLAIETDPDYLEARSSYGATLLDTGDVDEAIRQLTIVVQREPNHTMANYLMAQAFRMKGSYKQGVEFGRKAVQIEPSNPEAHFWLAENLRMDGRWSEAKASYSDYLRLSDFDNRLAGKFSYYVRGFIIGGGRKSRAGQKDVWSELRNLAYFGLCDCEKNLERTLAAIENCQKAIRYDAEDPFAHYVLGVLYSLRYRIDSGSGIETLAAALKHYHAVLDINSEIGEADLARKNIANIEAALQGNPQPFR